jgi:hypothetical protein
MAGFCSGVSDNKLLLDGIPLDAGQAERSFGQLLNTAGLASLHFSKDVTIDDFTRLVRAFHAWRARKHRTSPSRSRKRSAAAGKPNSTIKINEVKFIAADPLTGDISVAAQIAAQTLGPEFRQWLNDPQKLLAIDCGGRRSKCWWRSSGQAWNHYGALRKRSQCRRPLGRGTGTGVRRCKGRRRRRCAGLGRAAWCPCRKQKSFRPSGC